MLNTERKRKKSISIAFLHAHKKFFTHSPHSSPTIKLNQKYHTKHKKITPPKSKKHIRIYRKIYNRLCCLINPCRQQQHKKELNSHTEFTAQLQP